MEYDCLFFKTSLSVLGAHLDTLKKSLDKDDFKITKNVFGESYDLLTKKLPMIMAVSTKCNNMTDKWKIQKRLFVKNNSECTRWKRNSYNENKFIKGKYQLWYGFN